MLGIAATSFVKNGKTAPAVISPIAIVLQFISGVFFVFSALPAWMQTDRLVLPAEVDDPGDALGLPARTRYQARSRPGPGSTAGSRWC